MPYTDFITKQNNGLSLDFIENTKNIWKLQVKNYSVSKLLTWQTSIELKKWLFYL